MCLLELEKILIKKFSDQARQRVFPDWASALGVALNQCFFPFFSALLFPCLCISNIAAGRVFDVSVFDWLKQNQQCIALCFCQLSCA